MKPHRVGFSLIEVVLALGVMSVAVLGLLGLLGPVLTQFDEQLDRDQAMRLPTALRAYLAEVAVSEPDQMTQWERATPAAPATLMAWRSFGKADTFAAQEIGPWVDFVHAVEASALEASVFALQLVPQGAPFAGISSFRVEVFPALAPDPKAAVSVDQAHFFRGPPLLTFFVAVPPAS